MLGPSLIQNGTNIISSMYQQVGTIASNVHSHLHENSGYKLLEITQLLSRDKLMLRYLYVFKNEASVQIAFSILKVIHIGVGWVWLVRLIIYSRIL